MKSTICKIEETEEGVKIKFRENGEIVYRDVPFTNYFYIMKDDFDAVSFLVFPKAKELKTVVDKKGKQFVRIYLKNNFHRNMLRNEIEEMGIYTFEADVPTGKRLLIENQDFDLNQEGLRVGFYDIETDDRQPFVKDMKGDIVPLTAITSLAVKEFKRDGEGDVWYIRNEGIDGEEFSVYREMRKRFLTLKKKHFENDAEREEFASIREYLKSEDERVTNALFEGEEILLEKYFEYIKEFDVVSAWNGVKFDDAYVRFRANKHKMSYDSVNLVGFDYMESYKKNHLGAIKSYKLNDVAYEELKSEIDKEDSLLSHPEEIQKVDWRNTTDAIKYFDLFLLYPEVHKEYNIQDVQLLDMMEKKLGFFKLHHTQCRKAHCLMIDTLYNSRICDIMVLNESRKRGIIKISKPTEQEVKNREKKIPPGGFTFCFKPGLHWGVMCFDFASHYVNVIRTFNISSENYKRSVFPDLSKVFSTEEMIYINYCVEVSEKYVDKTNKFDKKKYEKDIGAKREELKVDDMDSLMWKFIRNYDNNIEHSEDEIFTPADINYDTRGWNVHPHFVFDNSERAIYPTILDDTNEERNRVKYSMQDYEKYSFEWWEHHYFEKGLKLIGNSLYGFTGFRGSRDYMIELPTAITSSARYLTKICMVEAWDNGMDITHGDTDSAYMVREDSKTEEEINKTKEFMDKKFKDRLDVHIPNFNVKDHSVNFEYEDTYEGMIPVKKKRYYYMYEGKIDGKGGIQTRSDVLQIAKDLQKELLEDIFKKNFDKEVWKDKLLTLKEKINKFELEEEHLIRITGLGKPIEEYGKPMIDGKTGLQKMTAKGEPRFSPIPAGVQIAKRLIEEGDNIDVGDKIGFVVASTKPKIQPITVREFRENKRYDVNYYYEKVIKGILEIMTIVYPDEVYTYFRDCWLFSDRQIQNLIEKQKEDEDDENDESDGGEE